jgi:hypothetical protein
VPIFISPALFEQLSNLCLFSPRFADRIATPAAVIFSSISHDFTILQD